MSILEYNPLPSLFPLFIILSLYLALALSLTRSLSLTSPLHALPRALSEYNPGEEGLEKEGTNTQNTSARRNSA